MGSNTLADMCRSYAEWKFEKLAVAYIPAVGSAANGQVALYRKSQRADPHLDPNGANFFPYVLNQRTGVIGPVWQPLSVEVSVSKDWRSTVPLEATDINDDCDGEVFVATNNNVAAGNSPPIGIVKIMYICTFKGMRRNPRSALIPLPLQIYFNMSIGQNGLLVVQNQTALFDRIGNDQSGVLATLPSATQVGHIYKVVIDSNRSSFGGATPSTLLQVDYQGQRPVLIDNGFTCYAVQNQAGGGVSLFTLHPTFAAAMSGGDAYRWGLSAGGLVFNLVVQMSLVASKFAVINVDI
jgi:hypothetical protein